MMRTKRARFKQLEGELQVFELMRKILFASRGYAKPVLGAGLPLGAAWMGLIDPALAAGICVAIYAGWITK